MPIDQPLVVPGFKIMGSGEHHRHLVGVLEAAQLAFASDSTTRSWGPHSPRIPDAVVAVLLFPVAGCCIALERCEPSALGSGFQFAPRNRLLGIIFQPIQKEKQTSKIFLELSRCARQLAKAKTSCFCFAQSLLLAPSASSQ